MKKKSTILIAVLGTTLVACLLGAWLLKGTIVAVLDPKGSIAQSQFDLIIFTTILSLVVVIPVFVMTFYIVWKYRASNEKAAYNPDWDHSRAAEAVWWGVPLALIAILAVITWITSHTLDPYRPLESAKKPVTIQVIALDWKWLFIYPDQDIASVNYIQIPEDTPINFELTADAPMNSFWIPQLGGQVYAMAGMKTKLHLLASEPGEYRGSSANISGEGFAGMKFTAKATSEADFKDWVQSVKASSAALDSASYRDLAKPSRDNPVVYYSSHDKQLYDTVMMKYMMPQHHSPVRAEPTHEHEGALLGEDMNIFGFLSAFNPFQHGLIIGFGQVTMVMGLLTLVGLITYFKRWPWLWKEWLTTLDPKKIGIMYIIVAAVMLLRGLADAGMMRAQQALSSGEAQGFLTSDHFQQVFTAHGTIMIFFVAMGVIFGLFNLLIPLQIGARDVAFPFLNAVSFWLFAAGAALVNASLLIGGEFAATGWLAYPPLSGIQYSPGVGVDYWIWSLQVAGAGSLLSGINFLVTIIKMRAPGMTLMKMPLFVWSSLGSLALIVFAFPILTATLGMLSLDRLLGMHFFTSDFGGNPMMYINLIWAWGHPEVYILILPAFGIFSEIVATFSGKRLFGYKSMVWAIISITVLSFLVWLHHFFTMGAGANVNAFFGIMTMVIAVPTGVKVFNWLFTMYRGRIRLTTPMLWFLGFVVTFTLGGVAGVLMSVPAIDFQVHNSLFLVAHFHTMIVGGVLFGAFAGLTYWFPKFAGYRLNETLGKWAFWCWLIGFLGAFVPLYILGLMGATRRLDHYDASLGWQGLFVVAGLGVALIFAGVGFQILQLIVSYLKRDQNRVDGDPWDGRTLEWATHSPPAVYNFAVTPDGSMRDAFWETKQKHLSQPTKQYEPIHLPKNSPLGLVIALCAGLLAFAIIWHIWWLAVVGFIGLILAIIMRISDDETEYTISVAEIQASEAALSASSKGQKS